MTGAQQRQQVVDDRADLAQVALDVRERRRPDRDHDVLRARRVGGALGELEPPAREHAVEHLLGPGLAERHPSVAQRVEHGRVEVDAEHVQPAIGKGQRQRQAHTPKPDHRDEPSSRSRDLRAGVARRHRRRSPPAVTLRSGVSPARRGGRDFAGEGDPVEAGDLALSRLSALVVAGGSAVLPERRIGARIGGAISTEAAIAASESSVGAIAPRRVGARHLRWKHRERDTGRVVDRVLPDTRVVFLVAMTGSLMPVAGAAALEPVLWS